MSSKSKCVIPLSELVEKFNEAQSRYTPIFNKMRVLGAIADSQLWKAIKVKFPKYQILPETNWVDYIKANLVASIYSVSKSAQLIPTCEEDRETVENLNIALEYIWDSCDVGYYQLQAGSNAALYNIGITQIGWNHDKTVGQGSEKYRGTVVFKDIDPRYFMRDPYAPDLQSSSYCVTWNKLHETAIMQNPHYVERFKAIKATHEATAASSEITQFLLDKPDASSARGYYTVYTYFVKYVEDDTVKIAEIHTLNNEHILYQREDIKPSCFPFVELYCNLPGGNIVGVSEPAKIVANDIAYNVFASILMTAEYKNQFPPRFISNTANLNIKAFSKYSLDADTAFVVNGDASKAVHYHQFPLPSAAAPTLQASLAYDIKNATGIDDRYTGRDTGSILTTGGIEAAQARVGTVDTVKILNYERYTKEMAQLILKNFVEFGLKREYYKYDPADKSFKKAVVDYKKLRDPAVLSYAVNISSELPKNKQRLAATANMLMEKQMQYGGADGVDLIQPEEWLEMQDLPNKEYMLKRMNVQRMSDITLDIADTLYNYAALTQNGLKPDEAIEAVAQNKMATRRGEKPAIEIPPMVEEPYETVNEAIEETVPTYETPGFLPQAAVLDEDMLESSKQTPIQLPPELLQNL